MRALAIVVLVACSAPSEMMEHEGPQPDAALSSEPPARLADVPHAPLAWEVGAPLAPALVTGRIYEELAANAADRMRDLAALGVRVIRIEIERGTTWQTYETIVSAARAAGIEVLALVSANSLPAGTPRPLDGTVGDFDTMFVPAYIAAVDETVAKLGVRFVEVWNEPDVYGFAPMFHWSPASCTPTTGATRYALLAVRVFETMHQRRLAGTPTPTLLAFGVSRHDDGCLRQSMVDAEPIRNHRLGYRPQHQLGEGLPTDIIAMHGYGNPGKAPSDTGYTYSGGRFADGVDEMLAGMPGSQPVWYTEIGYSLHTIGGADPEARQAAAVGDLFTALRARPRVTAMFWYVYRDDEGGGEGNECGLRDNSLTSYAPHPAYTRYQAAAAADDRTAPAGALVEGTPNAAMLEVRGWALDADGDAPAIEVAVDGAIVATATDGNHADAAACTVAHSARCPDVGFSLAIPRPAAGVHEIAVRATDRAGNARVIGRRDITLP